MIGALRNAEESSLRLLTAGACASFHFVEVDELTITAGRDGRHQIRRRIPSKRANFGAGILRELSYRPCQRLLAILSRDYGLPGEARYDRRHMNTALPSRDSHRTLPPPAAACPPRSGPRRRAPATRLESALTPAKRKRALARLVTHRHFR